MKNMLILAAGLTVLWPGRIWALATIDLNNYGPSANPILVIYPMSTELAPVGRTFVQLVTHQGYLIGPVDESLSVLPLKENGYFDAGVGVIPGMADNSTVNFTLRAWMDAANWHEASVRGSSSWTQTTGSWIPYGSPPGTSTPIGPDLMNPIVIIEMPEPSSLALGLIGGAVMLLFRRKMAK